MTRTVSEKTALDHLVALDVIPKDVANIVRPYARDTATAISDEVGLAVRAWVLMIDKSGSMKPLSHIVIAWQHAFLNFVLGSARSREDYLGQALFNHEIEYLQEIRPFRHPTTPYAANPGTRLLDDRSYVTEGETRLHDGILAGIASLAPLLACVCESGSEMNARVVAITDGRDDKSKSMAEDLKKVIDFLRANGVIDKFILVGIGEYDCRPVGKSVGITDVFQIHPDATPEQIRRMFDFHAVRCSR